MILTNYHTHSHYCDGSGELEEVIQYALSKGFKALGFSSHAPVEGEDWTMSGNGLHTYLQEVDELKEKYRDQLEIYKGLEIDFIPERGNASDDYFKKLKLHYAVGSFHMFNEKGKLWAIDGPDDHFLHIKDQIFRGSMAAFSEAFYRQVKAMLKAGGFDILGHLDLIKKKNRDNRFFREDAPWYQNQIRKILEEIKSWGGIMEVNTGGISRNAIDTVYPSPWIINKAVKMGIPLCISSDSHQPEHLDFYFDETRQILKEAGAHTVMALLEGEWKQVPFL